ncbi:uncharacterized protein K460DRAFT_143721 [Cucurbitaria berberidis CBS 394.84]|uniref:Uncharacterized protein n=1 Tax=Cucurbitaria berberidis CBS 394.84 TaxID=1168544 RepID=A0A9P4GD53_9PLEO|nr:uncharacterized protein K460DRAFT_143721 [Cucurbitaria berberidis CBS 394.84]KAF1843346.1 hypothetical protein K460DRAFT_143721 [Cucurbitaria berberidis CBS 394.84]
MATTVTSCTLVQSLVPSALAQGNISSFALTPLPSEGCLGQHAATTLASMGKAALSVAPRNRFLDRV